MGLAYRELIGSLYESWTIGIGKVYKYLTYNIIQRYKKWQKEGFEAKERESSSRPSPKKRGSVATEKIMKPPPSHILRSRGLPSKGGMWRVIYWVSPRTPEGGQAGKEDKLPSLHILRSRGAHTQLLLATFKEGELVTKKGRNDEGQMTRGYL